MRDGSWYNLYVRWFWEPSLKCVSLCEMVFWDTFYSRLKFLSYLNVVSKVHLSNSKQSVYISPIPQIIPRTTTIHKATKASSKLVLFIFSIVSGFIVIYLFLLTFQTLFRLAGEPLRCPRL